MPTLAQLTSKYAFLCVGSLPFTSANEAVTFLLDRPYLLPFWPELPNMGHSELMLERAKNAQSSSWNGYRESEAAGLFALKNKLLSRPPRLTLLKGQVAGPLTCMRFLGQTSSVTRLQEFAAVALRQAMWQAQFVLEFADHFLIVLDEPALTFWPQLSESDKSVVCEVYDRILRALKAEGIFVGVHSCKTVSHEILNISFDLYSFEWSMPEKNVELLAKAFMAATDRGAVFAPGVIPAVWESDPILGIVEGVQAAQRAQAWFGAVSGTEEAAKDHRMLWSATCGQAFASPKWVNSLYTNGHLDAFAA